MGYQDIIADLIASGVPESVLLNAVKTEAAKAARNEKLNKVRSDLCIAIMNYAKEVDPQTSFSAEDRKALEKVILDFEKEFARLMEFRKEIPKKKVAKDDEIIKSFLKARGLA